MQHKMKSFKSKKIALAIALSLTVAGQASASETASSMRGAIVGPAGHAVTDATITIIHQPTGTVTEVEVNESGLFHARGLRVGGPYAIAISSDVFQDEYQDNVFLNVGETLRLNTELKTSQNMERMVITGASVPFRTSGANSEFSEQDIANAPGVSRDLKDVLRQNPMANVSADGVTLSVAGLNPKFNSFVVDGVSQNDDFGLNANGYPTQRSPISIDAVESVALNTSPFSARYGGFSGAQINAVTKSGTNEISGTVFVEHTSDSLAGSPYSLDGEKITQDFEENTWGATLGMPIIKDKLFFFGSYESFDSPQQASYGPAGAGYPNDNDVTIEEVNRIQGIARDVYGLNDIGGYSASPIEQDEKILAKLDWNINDDHRASYTYQYTQGNMTNGMTSNSSYDFNLSSMWYNKRETLKTSSFNLYSDWTDDFSTDFKVAYKDQRAENNQITPTGIGEVQINTEHGGVRFGTEQNRHANELDNQNLEIRLVADYFMGDHQLSFGAQYNDLSIFNLYGRHALGTWQFDSIEDFQNGVVNRFNYRGTESGDIRDGAAEFGIKNTALFIEDVWEVNYDLELTFGLRYEQINMSDSPEYNENFDDRYGFDNTATMDGQNILLPRVGAKYTLTDDVVLRGGFGRYTGGSPNVWMANSFSNDGVSMLDLGYWDPSWDLDFGQVPGGAQDALVGGDGWVNALDHDFKMSSDWRISVGFDSTWDFGETLGDDWYFGGEFLYIKRENDIKYVDLARRAILDGEGNNVTDFNGRIMYEHFDALTGETCTSNCRTDLLLTNADEDGYSKVLTFSLSKRFDNGLRYSSSYTYQDVQEGNQGSSSTANSNYEYIVTDYDRHSTTMGTSPYEQKHRFVTTLGFDAEIFSGYNSSFNLFYEASSGDNVSYMMNGTYDGDGNNLRANGTGAYLAYIPTMADIDLGRVVLDGINQADFFAAMNKFGLSGGSFAGKGAGSTDWNHRMDFRFVQELPGFTDKQNGELYFDVKNVLNLLNSDWGQQTYVGHSTHRLVDFSYDQDNDVYTYSKLNDNNAESINARASAWEIKLGMRYRF